MANLISVRGFSASSPNFTAFIANNNAEELDCCR
jgi:hypothetical protein